MAKDTFSLRWIKKNQEADEEEANIFASNILINRAEWRQFLAQDTYRTKTGIQDFAQKVGIAPGIVVGRRQHEKLLPFSHCNDLKRRLEWNLEEHSSEM